MPVFRGVVRAVDQWLAPARAYLTGTRSTRLELRGGPWYRPTVADPRTDLKWAPSGHFPLSRLHGTDLPEGRLGGVHPWSRTIPSETPSLKAPYRSQRRQPAPRHRPRVPTTLRLSGFPQGVKPRRSAVACAPLLEA